MPKRMTICLAVAVTFWRSLDAPVVTSPKPISSAARPPRVIAMVSVSSAGVDPGDLHAALAVRSVDHDLAVEAAGGEQRRVEDVRAVGGRDEDDVVLHLEPVHLDEQLVERLLALVVTAA